MSKEDAAGPLKFLRFPVVDKQLSALTGITDRTALKDLKESMGIDADTGHRLPKPRRKRRNKT
jgi:hypothetical protein